MNLKNLKTLSISFLTLFNTLLLAQATPTSSLKSNGEVIYNEPQKKVDNFLNMFSEGNFYGRLRNNNFLFSTKNKNVPVNALGATLIYKSANYAGFDFNVGVYTSYSFFDTNDFNNVRVSKGKDTFSRYKYETQEERYMALLGQLNLGYTFSQTKLVLGRQLVETFYTRSNDTKMIPNTFDGLVLQSKDIKNSKITLAYLHKQKLRDHTSAHSILMYGDRNSSSTSIPKWTENDDSAMHRGLTYSALKAAGKPTNAPLIVLDAKNKSIENLKIRFASYLVPELISQIMTELNYKIKFDGFTVTPSVRYIQQFDNGAGNIGGAALKGNVNATNPAGYKNPNSLNSQMIAAKLVTKIDDYTINLAYTNILDKSDLVTPWRGFPTAGYTRSMGIYNWRANTKSYRLQISKGGLTPGDYRDGLSFLSILYLDEDEAKFIKNEHRVNSMYYFAAYVKNLKAYPQFQYRIRFGYRDFEKNTSEHINYLDSRLEFNYLF